MNFRYRRAILLCALLASIVFVLEKSSESVARGRKPELIVFSGDEFDGRSLEVHGSLYDMTRETNADGSIHAWNDSISSIIVVRGTWRLYQNGRCNTRLDDTPLKRLDIRKKEAAGGWSCIVSASPDRPLRLTTHDGVFADDDISSIELVSDKALPDVSRRKRSEKAPEIVVFWDNEFQSRSLKIKESVADLAALITATGEELNWEDNISSIIAKGGTWRLCQNRDFNRSAGGWSLLVSAGRRGDVAQSASECGGWTNDDIASIELVSDTVLEDWAVLNREARKTR